MMQGVYSVFDRKAALYGQPILFANDDMAKRGCADLLRAGGDSPMVVYPDDFDVYLIGSFDNETGMLAGAQPLLVCRFADFVSGR